MSCSRRTDDELLDLLQRRIAAMKGQLAQLRAERREIVAELSELEGRVDILQLPGTRLGLVESKEADDAQRFRPSS
jgi:hypothetical protein